MQYFTLQAQNMKDAFDKMKNHYGDNARILTHREIRLGGFLGLFAKRGIEVTGYISDGGREVHQKQNEKRKILEAAKKEQILSKILNEIQVLKKSIKPREEQEEDNNPTLKEIKEILELNDFTPSFIRNIIDRTRKSFSLDDLGNLNEVKKSVLKWIGEQIMIYPTYKISQKKPVTYIIVGPTGVGKTTTIAKLAAIYGVENEKRPASQVRMITIDNYRIAAKKQIETYAQIMQIPVTFAETYNDLLKLIALYQDVDLILIDTIGKSPSDYIKLGEMKRILSACGSISETHLAISATTKSSDVEEILRQFEPLMYKSVILTKLDETNRIGNILSVLIEKGKSISYITDGQTVPQDIHEASVLNLLQKIEGIRIGSDYLEGVCEKKNDPANIIWR